MPSAFETVSTILAIVGVWQVAYALVKWLPLDSPPGRLATIVSGLSIGIAVWIRLTSYPQRVFSAAARNEKHAEQLREDLKRGMTCNAAYTSLFGIYAPAIAELTATHGGNRRMWTPLDSRGNPTLAVAIAAGQGDHIDTLLKPDEFERNQSWQEKTAKFAPQRQQYMSTLRRLVSTSNPFGDEEGSNLILSALDVESQITMHVGQGSYGQIVRTSDSLVQEFALFGYLCLGPRIGSVELNIPSDSTLALLPWRRKIHGWDSSVADTLFRPKHRAAGIGVSVALLVTGDSATEALVARRSGKVGTYPDMLHVVPSGMMASPREGIDRTLANRYERIPKTAMLTEFLEECYDVQELSGQPISSVEKAVDRNLASRNLSKLTPRLTGIAIDLLNLRTEVCATIDLRDYTANVDEIALCWEYANHSGLIRTPIADGSSMFDRTEFVQSGLACLDLAARDALDDLLQSPST